MFHSPAFVTKHQRHCFLNISLIEQSEGVTVHTQLVGDGASGPDVRGYDFPCRSRTVTSTLRLLCPSRPLSGRGGDRRVGTRDRARRISAAAQV
jgi:hypothetical protein